MPSLLFRRMLLITVVVSLTLLSWQPSTAQSTPPLYCCHYNSNAADTFIAAGMGDYPCADYDNIYPSLIWRRFLFNKVSDIHLCAVESCPPTPPQLTFGSTTNAALCENYGDGPEGYESPTVTLPPISGGLYAQTPLSTCTTNILTGTCNDCPSAYLTNCCVYDNGWAVPTHPQRPGGCLPRFFMDTLAGDNLRLNEYDPPYIGPYGNYGDFYDGFYDNLLDVATTVTELVMNFTTPDSTACRLHQPLQAYQSGVRDLLGGAGRMWQKSLF
jgi:hypothetical protein